MKSITIMNNVFSAMHDELHDATEELSRAASLMSELGLPEEEEIALLAAHALEWMRQVDEKIHVQTEADRIVASYRERTEPKIWERTGPRAMNEATRRFVLSDLCDELGDAAEELYATAIMMTKLRMSAAEEVAKNATRVFKLLKGFSVEVRPAMSNV